MELENGGMVSLIAIKLNNSQLLVLSSRDLKVKFKHGIQSSVKMHLMFSPLIVGTSRIYCLFLREGLNGRLVSQCVSRLYLVPMKVNGNLKRSWKYHSKRCVFILCCSGLDIMYSYIY